MHQLTEVEMPSHSHQVEVEGWDFYYSQGGYDGFAGPQEVPTTNQEETSFEGGDQPHNNMQPYMALNYMMKVQAVQDIFSDLQTVVEQQQNQINQLINAQAPYSPGYQEFSYTGEPQFFVVPAGVEVLNIQCFGASGGNGEGRGGFISAQFS